MQALTAVVYLALGIMIGALVACKSIEGSRHGADYWGTCEYHDCGE